jgi:hypothetical protein
MTPVTPQLRATLGRGFRSSVRAYPSCENRKRRVDWRGQPADFLLVVLPPRSLLVMPIAIPENLGTKQR